MNRRHTIVFLAVNASYAHSSLAAWRLRSVVAPAVWDWHTVEVTINDDPEAVLNRVAALQPTVLGVTLYLFNRRFVIPILQRLREICPDTVVVAGGPECLGDNRRLIEVESAAHAAVRGEGERALPAVLDAIDRPAAWRAIPGLCTSIGGGYHDGGWAEAEPDLDALPPFYDTALAGLHKPFVQLETSRGCGNGCLFCTSRQTGIRRHSLARVRTDLEVIRRHGVPQVRVLDRTFNEDADRVLSLVRIFRDEFPEIRFHLEIDPARVSDRLADEMAAAGVGRFHLEAGVQSLDEAVYAQIGRQSTARRTREGLQRLCSRPELEVHVDLIAGLPGGTLASLVADVEALIRLEPREIQLERLKLLPGTPLAGTPERWGLVAEEGPPYGILVTPDMSGEDLRAADELRWFLDWCYNAASLRPVVISALANDSAFVARLLASEREFLGAPLRPPLEARFRMLHRVLVGCGNPAARALEWEWIRRGFSLRHGLCPAEPWKRDLPAGAVLVEGDSERPTSRRWRVELDGPHIVCCGANAAGVRSVVAVYRLDDAAGEGTRG